MVAVIRSTKIYFQTPWISAQYTFDFPLNLPLSHSLYCNFAMNILSMFDIPYLFIGLHILSVFRAAIRNRIYQ